MSESPPPSADAIQKWLTTAENLIALIADNLRRGTWVKRLLLVDALIVFGLNPSMAGQILKIFVGLEQLPDWYTRSFWLAVGLLFVVALVIALRTPVRSQTDIAEFKERKAIKGLRPFTAADTEIFAKLQRNRSLRECLEAITQDSFRFGILLGESGCGKTSFLRAGLVPMLSDPAATHRGVYIQFNDRAPVDTIREALVKELKLESGIEGDGIAAFQELLTRAQAAAGKPLILVFDQFEQFFVHYKTKEERQRFVAALTAWYRSSILVKILISIRGDMSDRLVELQHAIRYSLAPQEVFRLEKFAPLEAAAVLRVIAETEALKFDERFVQEFSERELARDGLISPVDLQILSWMIERQNTAELKAFDRVAFQKFGGMEGLLTRFLEKTLEARVIKSQREAAVKVLLALTDLERNLRAGVLTVAELQAKSPGTQPDEIAEAAVWLGRSDVRLITPVERDAETAYELAHERLIPAVRQVAGKELTQTQKANQLLDRRVNEWIGNNYSSRYLFNIWELWLIKRQKPYLTWGSNRLQKERFLKTSKKTLCLILLLFLAIPLLPFVSIFWSYNPSLQNWKLRQRLSSLDSLSTLSENEKVNKLISIAQKTWMLDSVQEADTLRRIIDKTKELQNLANRARILRIVAFQPSVVDQTSRLENSQKTSLLKQIVESAAELQNSTYETKILVSVVIQTSELEDSQKTSVLEKVILSSVELKNPADRAKIFKAIIYELPDFNDVQEEAEILKQILGNLVQIDEDGQAQLLEMIVSLSSEEEDMKKAFQVLEKLLKATNNIQNPELRAWVLTSTAKAYMDLGNTRRGFQILEQVSALDL
jgi:hypothetical protein